jgi:T5SS/PEP-CTERM-associated repeat protein
MRGLVCTICVLCAALCSAPVFAAITWSGSYSPTSSWTSSTTGYIGYQGDGSMSVSSGSTQSSSVCYIGGSTSGYTTATGTATVSGDNTAVWNNTYGTGLTYVGYYGIGNLNIQSGGKVSDQTGYIGYQSASTGANTVNVDGYNGGSSTWSHTSSSSDGLYVGYYGNGLMNITNGGKVTNTNSRNNYIGRMAGSTGTVNVDGTGNGGAAKSQWDTGTANTGILYVGSSGAGNLNITNGGVVSSGTGYIGSSSAAGVGAVIIDGSGGGTSSKWVVGTGGARVYNGSLTIRNGGQMTVGGTTTSFYVGYYTSLAGTLTVNTGGALTTGTGLIGGLNGAAAVDGGGSSWTINAGQNLYVGNTGTGTLTISNGGTVTLTAGTSSIYVGGTASAAGNGTLNISNGGNLTATGSSLYVGYYTGSAGMINFSAGGGNVSVASLIAKGSQVTGSGGVVNAKGLWTDGDVVVDSTTKTLTVGTATVNLNLTASSGNGPLGAGYQGSGNLTISNGVAITTNGGYFGGYYASSSGICTVDGAGTSWNMGSTPTNPFYVGNYGNSTLRITNGGTLTSTGSNNNVACNDGAAGSITVDGAGSTWNAGGLTFGQSGTNTSSMAITNGGHVNTSYNNCSLGSSAASTVNVTVDGAGSQFNHPTNSLFVGNGGTATVTITNGGSLTVNGGFGLQLGTWGTAQGTVIVKGAGSNVADSSGAPLYVGNGASGTVIVRGGGSVSAPSVYLGAATSSTGLVSIDVGTPTASSLSVGGGTGTITIANGTGSGTLRVVAGAGAAATTYTPVSAGTWADTGATYQPIGGTWNSGTHVFTASDVTPAASGSPASLDTSAHQRLLVTDSGNDMKLGASFLANSGTVGLTATTTTSGPLLGLHQSVLDGWTFSSVTGYMAGTPTYLSLAPGRYYPSDGLQWWSYDGSTWSALAANDFTFDGTWASFTAAALDGKGFAVTGVAALAGDTNMDGTVNISDLSKVLTNYDKAGMTWADGDFSGDGTVNISDLSVVLTNYDHSLSAADGFGVHAVPEPSVLALLAAGLAGLLFRIWRKQR